MGVKCIVMAIAAVAAFLLAVLYSCCVISSQADDMAEAMFREHQKEKLKHMDPDTPADGEG